MSDAETEWTYDPQSAYELVTGDVAALREAWILSLRLFGHSERRVDVLNTNLGWLAKVISDVLLDYVQLRITRLTDPADGKRNVTLERVILDLPSSAERERLCARLSRLGRLMLPIRRRRSKVIAHSDLKTRLGAKVLNDDRKPLKRINLAVKTATRIIEKVAMQKGTTLSWALVADRDDVDVLEVFLEWGHSRRRENPAEFIEGLKSAQQRQSTHWRFEGL